MSASATSVTALKSRASFVLDQLNNPEAKAYLLTRGWFCRDTNRLARTFKIGLAGFGSELFYLAGDFDEELDRVEALIEENQRAEAERSAVGADDAKDTASSVLDILDNPDAKEYLLTRGWFCHDPVRLARTKNIGLWGFGSELCYLAGDFDEELERVEGLIEEDRCRLAALTAERERKVWQCDVCLRRGYTYAEAEACERTCGGL